MSRNISSLQPAPKSFAGKPDTQEIGTTGMRPRRSLLPTSSMAFYRATFLRMIGLAICFKLVSALFYLEMVECVVPNENDALVTLKSGDFSFTMGDNRTNFDPATVEEPKSIDFSKEFKTVTSNSVEESRKQKQKQNQQGFMQRILPIMVIPFLVSTSMIPLMLFSIKFMLLKSAFLGVIGISLMLLNMFRQRTNAGGVFNHNINSNDAAMEYYGYHGDEEYGAYVNRRRKRNTR